MNASTAYAIQKLPLNKREREHRSRVRLGFYVYLSRYFFDFSLLLIIQQHQCIFSTLGTQVSCFNEGNDNSLINSTNFMFTDRLSHRIIHKEACVHWRIGLLADERNAWNNRVKKMNKRKVPGKFLELPWNNNKKKPKSTTREKQYLLDSLLFEFNELVIILKRMMTRRPKAILSSKNYKSGAEKVIISTQTYRDFCVSYIIELAIFGDSFKYLHTGEIIAQTIFYLFFFFFHQNCFIEAIILYYNLFNSMNKRGNRFDSFNSITSFVGCYCFFFTTYLSFSGYIIVDKNIIDVCTNTIHFSII